MPLFFSPLQFIKVIVQLSSGFAARWSEFNDNQGQSPQHKSVTLTAGQSHRLTSGGEAGAKLINYFDEPERVEEERAQVLLPNL